MCKYQSSLAAQHTMSSQRLQPNVEAQTSIQPHIHDIIYAAKEPFRPLIIETTFRIPEPNLNAPFVAPIEESTSTSFFKQATNWLGW